MPNKLEISDSSDLLFLVRSFINAFNTNLNEAGNMVEKLDSTYGSCISKVITINDVQLIAASLQNQKPQYIIVTASTIPKANEIKYVVKNNTGSTTIKFTRPKVFYKYSQAKEAIDINNQVHNNITLFHNII
ncbi:10618_t:CDS:2 [Cetraspora pellucida]|uniref:10618_t:CDS:1 n=1 Tax=Cetraspora pellucida TaxID=1433469 RepID=A0A9N9FVH6_9GLOM|nr:10618_t:CDS:2 [Cetraspora pellucida]